MKIYIDEALPESCSKCGFLVYCCECEGYENYCPFIGAVGYDLSDNLKNGAPVTPTWQRHEECPLEQMPHGEWIDVNGDGSIMKCSKCGEEVCCKNNNFCSNCGAAMRTKESKPEKSGPCMTCTCIDDITGRCLVGHYCEEYIHWKEGEAK